MNSTLYTSTFMVIANNSASWVTDTNGAAYQYLQYMPWGEPLADQRKSGYTYNSRYTFSGKERDEETGYSYFGARYYNSDISIWLSVDPMADKYPSESPYQFCGDNTIVLKDPNGQEKIICFSTNTGDSQQDKSNQNLIDAANSKATEDPVIHLFAHGIADNNGFCWGIMACDASGAFELSSPQDVHRFLLCNSEVYKTNQYYGDKSIVVLHSCKTGQEGSIAEKTSRTYGNLLVIAPSDNLNVSTNSKESCETGIKNNGKWILYYKGEMMDSFYDLPFIDDTDAFIHKYEKQYENDHPKTTFD